MLGVVLCMYACMYVYKYMYEYICMYMCVCVCVCVCVRVCIFIYTVYSALQQYWNSKDKIALLAVELRQLQI